jgi:small subunit ribosomal protein S21
VGIYKAGQWLDQYYRRKETNIAYVKVRDKESIESALRRFKKLVEREGILKEFKDKQYYKKPSQIRNEKAREMENKHRKAMGKKK